MRTSSLLLASIGARTSHATRVMLIKDGRLKWQGWQSGRLLMDIDRRSQGAWGPAAVQGACGDESATTAHGCGLSKAPGIERMRRRGAVPYTPLTPPTNLRVYISVDAYDVKRIKKNNIN